MTMVDATAAPFQADVCAVPIKEDDDDVSPVIEVIWDVEELELESVPISGRECLSPTSPVELEDDVFYDCETPLKSEDQAKKTFNLLVPFQPSATPSFSSLASPRGIRRKIKRFLFAFSPESIDRTEEFVALMGQGWTEDQLFHHLHREFTSSDGGRSSSSKQVAERDETLTETLLQCFTELNIGDSNAKSTTVTKLCVQFSESVLAIRTDVSGLPLGPEVTVLKEPHMNTKELTPQVAPTLGPNGMRRRRKEKKRRMPRLSHEDKLALYEWRTDLQSDKFLIKHLKRLSEQKLAEQQSAIAMAATTKISAPAPSGASIAEAAQPPSAPFAVSRSPLSLPSYPLWSRAPKPKTRISKSKETLSETGKGLQGVHNNTELTRHNRLGGHMSIV